MPLVCAKTFHKRIVLPHILQAVKDLAELPRFVGVRPIHVPFYGVLPLTLKGQSPAAIGYSQVCLWSISSDSILAISSEGFTFST